MRSYFLFAAGLILGFVQFAFSLSNACGQDEIIIRSRKTLYGNRQASIRIMEDAVAAHPDRIDYRIELVRQLDIDSAYFYANLHSMAALKDHPRSGELLENRIALNHELAGDLLPVMLEIEGYEQRAKEIQLWMSVGFQIPFQMSTYSYSSLARNLIDANLWEQANTVIQRGLEIWPENKILMGNHATVLAKKGKLQEAFGVHLEYDYHHPNIHHQAVWMNWGLGELFLSKGQPGFVASVFKHEDVEKIDERLRLVLFAGLKLSGQDQKAAEVRKLCNSGQAILIEIGLQSRLNTQDADATVATWIKYSKETENDPDSQFNFSQNPRWEPTRWPASLVPLIKDGRKYVAKYVEENKIEPKALELVKNILPTANEVAKTNSLTKPKIELLSLDEKVALKMATLKTGTPRENWRTRNELAHVFVEHSQFDRAAAAVVPNAIGFHPPEYTFGLGVRIAAVDWAMYRRKAQTAKYFLNHPEKISTVRRALHKKTSKDVIDRKTIVDFGPEILGVVLDELQPNVISGKDRSEIVKIIQAIGNEQEIPVLLDVLGLVVKETVDVKGFPRPGERYDLNRLNTERALHVALEKLTMVENTETERVARVEFWRSWWDENAERIIKGY